MQSGKHKRGHQPEQKNPKHHEASGALVKSHADAPDAGTRDAQRQDQQARANSDLPQRPKVAWPSRDNIGLFFDGVVTVATVIGVGFLVLQWRQTDAALGEARRANEMSARQFEQSQRAWVTIRDASVVRLLPNSPAVVQLHVVNTGSTPALNTVLAASAYGRASLDTTKSAPTGKPLSVIVLTPEQVVTTFVNTTEPVTQGFIDAIRAGKTRLFAHGTIYYQDGFQPPQTGYQTDFCFSIGMEELAAPADKGGTVGMSGCDTGNGVKSNITWPFTK